MDDLYTIFTSRIDSADEPVITVPERELNVGELEVGETYRIAVLPPVGGTPTSQTTSTSERGLPDPPVEVGDEREVEIEDIGEQGDGITRVERGFVVIVPDTEQGERVTVEITDVGENVAFAEAIERHSYYD